MWAWRGRMPIEPSVAGIFTELTSVSSAIWSGAMTRRVSEPAISGVQLLGLRARRGDAGVQPGEGGRALGDQRVGPGLARVHRCLELAGQPLLDSGALIDRFTNKAYYFKPTV